ncbi:trithorax group protein osa-like [Salmo salar]|uniref:Trithorax group protein osa-like n=1 Tax=Salmo salar TaxID=8030 RepID=A0ABM3DEZ4_SALSA|nr:trithorax group protein osa-like [Salmo salar]
MALALAESANKALRQGASPPYRPPQSRSQDAADTRYQRSLSADAGELLSSDPNQLYSTVRPLSVWMTEGEGNTTETAADTGHGQGERTPGQDMGTLSSETSDSVASNSELSGGSASGDDQTPSPIYKNQKQLPQSQPPNPGQSGERPSPTESQPQRKPPAYSRQFSAPHLQQKSTSTQSKPSSAQLLHSKSESPLTQVRAFQPTRPKVPPKPLDLERPHRAPLAQTEMRRSLDSGRIRRIFGQQGNPPLARAFSERLSGAPDHLARYHAASQPSPGQQPPQQAQIRPVPLSSTSEDQGRMENFYYEIAGPENSQGPPSYARHSYQNMRLDLEGNFRPAPHLEANKRPISRGHHQHQPQPLHHNQGGPRESGPQLWSKEVTRAWAAAHSQSHSFSHGHSHSHHHSQDGSTHHHHPSHHHPRPQRQTSSSVRLARSEMHPLPSSSMVPLALHQHQRNLHRSNRSASTDLTASQLHPYFENGKVCYRKPEDAPLSLSQPPQGKSLQPSQPSPPQAHRPTSKDLSEPIYVNFPFPSPSTGAQNTKSWTSTDLDGDSPQDSEPLATPNDPPPPEDQRQSSPRLVPDQAGSTSVSLTPSTPDSPSAHNDSAATSPGSIQESDFLPASTSTGIHYRSRSDPQSSRCSTEPIQGLSGKEIASLLIEKLAEEERAEGPSTVTSSSASTSSSPAMEHPANPYPSQQHNQSPPAYNVYTPGPSRIRAPQRAGAGGFQRQDPLRRSSPGGQYRQAFDVMPSGDQVLKYYRTQNFTQGEHQSSGANPYPPSAALPGAPLPHPEPPGPLLLRLPQPAPLGALRHPVCNLLQPDAGSPQALPRPARRPPVQPVPLPAWPDAGPIPQHSPPAEMWSTSRCCGRRV